MLSINDYNYPLPDERIAKYPLAERDHSKLLVYKDGHVCESQFYKVGEYLPADSLLVYNNTRVIQARLVFHKETGARIEIFCLEPLAPHDYQLNLSSTTGCVWKCMIGNLKKWKDSQLESKVVSLKSKDIVTLKVERLSTIGNTHEVRFSWDDETISFAEILDAMGELPIPPYLNRATEESDKTTYQTVYSRIKGSVAAPTAGLHFTDKVLEGLRAQGIQTTEVTLHVGAGTFQPVKVEDANEHVMHTEIIAVSRQTIVDIQGKLGHICAVGTTSMRTLESLYWIGAVRGKRISHADETIHVGQFEPYESECTMSAHQALQNILDYLDATGQDVLHAETQIMIRPGYTFRIVDILITNFHQPKSTLLLLVSAFVGGDWHTIYDYALSHDFRFLSYGDSSILFGKKDKEQRTKNEGQTGKALMKDGLIDTHCHIDDEQYQEDFDAFIQSQKDGGVSAILVPGVGLSSLESVPAICARYPDYLFPAMGLHPEEVKEDWCEVLDKIEGVGGGFIAIGEIGLDYHFDVTYKEEQKLAFRRQLDWALHLNLPVMIHSRDATEDMLTILKEYVPQGLRGVMHCFSGSREVAQEYVKMGLYLGIGGVITFKNAKLAEHLEGIPLEKIVLETDAPWMAPTPYRGKRNEPAWMIYVAAKLSEVYHVDVPTIIRQTNQNARDLFFKDK